MPNNKNRETAYDQAFDAPEPDVKGPEHYLQAWRKAARPKVTGEVMAEHLGVSRSTYSDYETGTIDMSISQLRKAADFLRIPLGYVTDYHPDQVPADMLEIWGRVPKEDRPKALQAIRIFERKDGTNN